MALTSPVLYGLTVSATLHAVVLATYYDPALALPPAAQVNMRTTLHVHLAHVPSHLAAPATTRVSVTEKAAASVTASNTTTSRTSTSRPVAVVPSPRPTPRIAAKPTQPTLPAQSNLATPPKGVTEPSTPATATSSAQAASPRLPDASESAAEPPLLSAVHARFRWPPNAPTYPPVARRRGQEGTVLVDVWLDAAGAQEKQTLAQSSGFAVLDAAALDAVRDWQFLPTHVGLHTRASRVRVPVTFALR